jgi:hypothetical protein
VVVLKRKEEKVQQKEEEKEEEKDNDENYLVHGCFCLDGSKKEKRVKEGAERISGMAKTREPI